MSKESHTFYYADRDRCSLEHCPFPRTEGSTLCQGHAALRERFAAASHEIWSHWMRYMFSRCHFLGEQGAEDTMVIPGDLVERWTRQMKTDYVDLSEQEHESDREQADKLLAALQKG